MTKREFLLGLFLGLMIGWTFVRPWMKAHGWAP